MKNSMPLKHINKLINELPSAIKFKHDGINTIYELHISKVDTTWRICYANRDSKATMIVPELEAEEALYVNATGTDFIDVVRSMLTLLKQIEHYIVHTVPVMNIQC